MIDPDQAKNHMEMQRLTAEFSTKADKIRALAREGYTRPQIAEFLGIRYQHVRNVLVDDERKAKAALGPVPADWPADTKSAEAPSPPGLQESAVEGPRPASAGRDAKPPENKNLRSERPKSPDRACRVDIGPDGVVLLPKHIMDAANTGPGGYLLVRFVDDEIKLVTPEATTRKILAITRRHIPEGVSLVEELHEERRREFEREEDEARRWGA